MPLRKKHVRRVLTVVLMAGVLGPLAALAVWGLWLRGGMDNALKAQLESRLRCKAKVRGAKPAGLGAATVSEIEMTWEAGAGKLIFLLHGVDAKAGEEPETWNVTAASGSMDLSGPQPLETLAALNQRLVQADARQPIAAFNVEDLRLGLDTDRLIVTDRVKLESYAVKKGTFVVNLTRRAGPNGAPNESTEATVQLNAASPDGLFRAATVDVHGFPARQIVLKRGDARNDRSERAGVLDPVRLTWPAPGKGKRPPCQFDFTAQGLALADWTEGLRGGPVSGTADVAVAWKRESDKPAALDVSVTARDGRLEADALQALTTFPGGIFGAGKLLKGPVAYGRAAWVVRVTGNEARFMGDADLWGRIPLLEVRVFGYAVPVLWASSVPFDASATWPRFEEGLFGPAKTAK
jgi:hypothetical protein